MYYKRAGIIDYPNHGKFYRRVDGDLSKPLDEREEYEEFVYETDCDIQEVSKAANPVLIATFSVFFPWDKDEEVPIRRGYKFVGEMNGMTIEGLITNVIVSQLNGCVCYVKDYYAEEG